MNVTRPPSKRKRVITLVKNSIGETALSGNDRTKFDKPIRDSIQRVVEESPAKYFDVADDRKIAGQVLAYMLEHSEIGSQEVNSSGYRLVKLIAETDQQGFRKSTPATFAKLQSKSMAAPGPTGLEQG